MKIVIWTKSPPKVLAIEEAAKRCIYFDKIEIKTEAIKVESWVSDMPLSIEENMKWAQNRAINAKKEIIDADFYIWMEWWTSYIWQKAYLFWVVYILNSKWEWHFWFSNMMEVPKLFETELYKNKKELWEVLEKATWILNASKKNWAFWAWSDDMLTRKDQFISAFLSAIPTFYNNFYK